MTGFDADTELAPAGDGRFRGRVGASWGNGAGPGINGGLFAALTARAARLATGLDPRSLTIHYLQAPEVGEVDVMVTVPRQGRSTAFSRLEFIQDGRHVAQAVAVTSAWRPDAPAWADARPPAVAPFDDCTPIDPESPQAPPLVGNYEMRFDWDADRRPATMGGYIRTVDARPSDHVALAAMTDAFMPPAFLRSPEPVVVPTLELTLHFRGEPPSGEHPWITGAFTSRAAAGGVVEEDGELWSADGILLVQSRQLAIMRRRPA